MKSKKSIKGGKGSSIILIQKGGASTNEPTAFQVVVQDIFNKYGVVFLAMIFICIVAIYALLNQNTIETYIWNYMFAILFPLIMIFAIILNINGNFESMVLFFKLLGGIGLVIGFVYIYTLIAGKVQFISGYVKYVIYAIIGLLGLAIIYKSFLNYLSKLQGWPGFIAQLIFYIPCMLYDFLLYILDDLKLTPASAYIILAIEFILIVLFFLVPWIVNATTNNNTNGKLLLNKPVFLDKETEIANSDDLIVPVSLQDLSNPNDKNLYRTNYCISMWVYVDPQPASNFAYSKETAILTYGHTDNKGTQHVKPMIRYYGGGDGRDQLEQRDKYVFYFYKYKNLDGTKQDKEMIHYDVALPNQKWNQIVLNYNRNVVDLFINGNLEKSFNMKDNLPLYNPSDKITVGEEKGLRGAICNVMYYHHPLSRDEIATGYNLMVNKNPPTNPYADSVVNKKEDNKQTF
jgi:hypothetical protein